MTATANIQGRTLHVLNLGAGVQSTTVFLLMREGIIPAADHAIFADTQEEPQAVYEHLRWLQSLDGGLPILVRSAGKLGDDLVAGKNSTGQRFASIPAFTLRPDGGTGVTPRQCSKEYKSDVIGRAVRRDLLGLQPRQPRPKSVKLLQSFGISRDEAGRAVRIAARIAKERNAEARFPLIELGWTRADCLRWLESRVPHSVPRSACVFCPYHSDNEWLRIKQTDAAGWARAVEVDESLRKNGSIVNWKLDQQLFVHRSCVPLVDVVLGDDPRQGKFPNFIAECEGVCGV